MNTSLYFEEELLHIMYIILWLRTCSRKVSRINSFRKIVRNKSSLITYEQRFCFLKSRVTQRFL